MYDGTGEVAGRGRGGMIEPDVAEVFRKVPIAEIRTLIAEASDAKHQNIGLWKWFGAEFRDRHGLTTRGVVALLNSKDAPIYCDIAEVATAAERERCAKIAEPVGKRPCDCERCYCGKPEDAQAVEAWDAMASIAAAIRKGEQP